MFRSFIFYRAGNEPRQVSVRGSGNETRACKELTHCHMHDCTVNVFQANAQLDSWY